MIKMDEHKFFKATKWVDHDNNEPFYNRPEQRHAMPPFSQLHVAVVSTINPLKTPGIPMDATWAMPGILRIRSWKEGIQWDKNKLSVCWVVRQTCFLPIRKFRKPLVCECENRQDASTGQSSFFPNIFTKKVGLGTLKLMIISFYKRNAIIVKWETTPGLHQPLWAWSIPTGPAFGTVPANDAAGRCPGQAPYRRRGCSAPQGSNCWQLPGIMFCFIKLYWKMIGLLLSHLKWFDGI